MRKFRWMGIVICLSLFALMALGSTSESFDTDSDTTTVSSSDADEGTTAGESGGTGSEETPTAADVPGGSEEAYEEGSEEYALSVLAGHTLYEAKTLIDELGYTAVYINTFGIDQTGDVEWIAQEMGMDQEFYTISLITNVTNIDAAAKTVQIEFIPSEIVKQQAVVNQNESALQEKLDVYAAWEAVQIYADLYAVTQGYEEIDVHFLTGVLAEKAQDENTWFLKALCTVKTANTKTQMNCEACVSGTTDSPQVTYFILY